MGTEMKNLVYLVFDKDVCALLVDECPDGVNVFPDDNIWTYNGKTYPIGSPAEYETERQHTILFNKGGLAALHGEIKDVYDRTKTADLNHIRMIVCQLARLKPCFAE